MRKAKAEKVPKSATTLLKKALNAYPAFAEVDHALFQITNDESEWQPDVLKFSYRDRPYYAHVGTDGHVVLARPGGFSGMRQVGKPVPIDSRDLATDIKNMIDSVEHE